MITKNYRISDRVKHRLDPPVFVRVLILQCAQPSSIGLPMPKVSTKAKTNSRRAAASKRSKLPYGIITTRPLPADHSVIGDLRGHDFAPGADWKVVIDAYESRNQ
jgi:hypothetical protein